MAYNYQTGTNKLNYIADPYHLTSADIEGQSANNYTYDAIGNLTQDVKGGINDIMWNPYGKITRIDKGTNGVLLYSYDAMGNRIKKSFTQSNDNADKTWYVRDASGNIMAIYSRKNYGTNQQVLLENYELYGSDRLGSLNLSIPVEGDYNLTPTTNYTRSLGLKQYELSNHLGNVLTTFSDQRVFAPTGMSSTNSNALIAKLISAQDYYPFGMLMDGRSWNTDKVKFGFNGKENDNEVKGIGNQQDYGMRIYDPRIGRFLSVDPIAHDYPWYSPYQFAGNSPIKYIDLDGLEPSNPNFNYTGNVYINLLGNEREVKGNANWDAINATNIDDAVNQLNRYMIQGNLRTLNCVLIQMHGYYDLMQVPVKATDNSDPTNPKPIVLKPFITAESVKNRNNGNGSSNTEEENQAITQMENIAKIVRTDGIIIIGSCLTENKESMGANLSTDKYFQNKFVFTNNDETWLSYSPWDREITAKKTLSTEGWTVSRNGTSLDIYGSLMLNSRKEEEPISYIYTGDHSNNNSNNNE